jgi:hypothetical protein
MSPTRFIAVWLACGAALASSAAMAQTANMAAPDALDDVVDVGDLEVQKNRPKPRELSYPDVVTVTRRTRAGNGLISLLLQPFTQQREFRFRASDARQLAAGENSRLKLRDDRLTKDGAFMTTVNLEFIAGMEEADGLPALIPVNATTSLFNYDYARLENSSQPVRVTLTNAMDPETQRCAKELHLSGSGKSRERFILRGEEVHPGISTENFILLGDGFADCSRTTRSREANLIFADTVPQRLRQELRDLHDPVFNQFSRNLGNVPGTVFVIWLPEASGNDIRLVRGLSRTSLLVFNGPSWDHGFTAQQRDALWEEIAKEQMLLRIPELLRTEAAIEAAADYLLKLTRAERQQATISLLTTEVPEWISACARAMSVQSDAIASYDCGLVVQFVYDAVARAKSKGQDTVMRTWRTLLADASRRKQSGVKFGAFLDSSADARRIVNGLQGGDMEWTAFAAEMDKVGVELLVTPGQLVPTVQVQSLAYFHD